MAGPEDIEEIVRRAVETVQTSEPATLEHHINNGLAEHGLPALVGLAGLLSPDLLESGLLIRSLTRLVLIQLGLEGDPDGSGKSAGGV